jgi:SAM-dependent methyltransferase
MNLEELLPLLQCPLSKKLLQQREHALVSDNGICSYPLRNGVPIFIANPDSVRIYPSNHASNPLSEDASSFIKSARGRVLNLSAGGSNVKEPNVVELEYGLFRNTDVVGDAHSLPFRDGVFSACVCMNAFEHYRCPRTVLAEVHRVLEPGGRLFLHTAGLQPLHESPFHFYNVTRYGLEEWLKNFEILELGVSSNFNPVYALAWIASEIEKGVAQYQSSELNDFLNISIRDLVTFWKLPITRGAPIYEIFHRLDHSTQEACAAGWQAIAIKK